MGSLLFVVFVFGLLAFLNLPAFVLTFVLGFLVEYGSDGPFQWTGVFVYSLMIAFIMLIILAIFAVLRAATGNTSSTAFKVGAAGVIGYFLGRRLGGM